MEDTDMTVLSVQLKKSFLEAIDNVVKRDTHINRSDWVRAALREKLEREMERLGLKEYPIGNKDINKTEEELTTSTQGKTE